MAACPDSNLLHELHVHQMELEMQNETLRQTQLELEASRDRYLHLYDFAPVAYLTVDRHGMITEANLTAAKLFGMGRQSLRQSRFSRLISEAYSERWYRFFLNLLKYPDTMVCELQLRRSDATLWHAQLSCQCIAEAQGGGVRITFTDITAQRESEQKQSESEEKFRIIFEGALDGILLIDPLTLRLVSANPAFCKMLDYSQNDIPGLTVPDIHPSGDVNLIIKDIQRHVSRERELSVDVPVLRRDGSVFYVDIRSSHVRLNGKDLLIGLFRDITERRAAEEGRRISELKHRLLFENSRDALMTLAPPLWRFTSANQATLTLFGVSSIAEFVELEPWRLAPERQADGADSVLRAQGMIDIAMQEGSNSFEYLHRRLDGSVFTADVRLSRIDLGAELFLQATVRDITERKQTEAALRTNQTQLRELAAQGAASREAELKRIAREVHDELGQVLTALRMDISLLRMQFKDPLLQNKIEDMRVLVDQAIQGVRDVTVNLRPPALDMGLIPALNWLCSEFIARNNIRCALQAADLQRTLSEEQTMVMFRIVQESLTNVLRHAGANKVEITLSQVADGLTVTVQDDGRGFDPDTPSRKKSFGLLGMKERALAINGSVHVASSPSQGTMITASIPFDVIRLLRRKTDDTSVNR
ncbi:MAG: hypothetical protein A2342_01930 [Gallionellales bacterium RIFOXYB12_FULL_54_9]|nr:MAG: hypothetical protein A2342_01930 [Gallionellales bacterium RIFOXYB12_FULL_54_9]